MLRRFRSLLINNVQLSIPGLRVLTLAAHRHLPELALVEPHRHPWCQAILYLSGAGQQTLANARARIEPGTLVMVPAGVFHAFRRAGSKAPLCLLIDFRWRRAKKQRAAVASLSRSELALVRQNLAYLIRLQVGGDAALRLEGAALILKILVALLRSAGWLQRELPLMGGQSGRAVQALLSRIEPGQALSEIVQRSGYQRDYLNRLVKRETGLTLGQYLAQRRLALAKRLLSEGIQVAQVAASAGLPDQSYFARWFRRQTGQTPSAWHKMKTRSNESSPPPAPR
jgi:AraC family L-rhamnose operon transcriptional activator RhaR